MRSAPLPNALGDLRTRVRSRVGNELLQRIASVAAYYGGAQRRVMLETLPSAALADVRRRFEREVLPERRRLSEAIDSLATYKERQLDTGLQEAGHASVIRLARGRASPQFVDPTF